MFCFITLQAQRIETCQAELIKRDKYKNDQQPVFWKQMTQLNESLVLKPDCLQHFLFCLTIN